MVYIYINKEGSHKEKLTFELINKKYINYCVDKDCGEDEDLYAHLSTNSSSEILNNAIETMNANTDYYYNYVIGTASNVCDEYSSVYKYRRGISNEYYYYIDDKYVTFAVLREEKDFCNDTILVLPVEVYFYDLTLDKILSQDEIKENLDYNDKKLDSLITDHLKGYNEELIRDTYYGKALYFDNNGKVYVSFSWNENDFMSILLN